MNWGVSAAVHAALDTPVPADAEAETYPRSAIEEAAPEQTFDVFLPQRRPAVPHPATPGDETQPRRVPAAVPAARHQPPDLALLDRVLGSLQRMA